jgi:hypothetical protein
MVAVSMYPSGECRQHQGVCLNIADGGVDLAHLTDDDLSRLEAGN